LNYSSHNRLIAGTFDRAIYPHPNPTILHMKSASDGWG